MQTAGLSSCNFGEDINTKYGPDKTPVDPRTPTRAAGSEPCRVRAALGTQPARRGHVATEGTSGGRETCNV